LEAEESANSLAAFERGDHELVLEERGKNFNQAAGWIFVALFLVLSWKTFPLASALQGGSALPLAQDWFSLFARAGASWQPIGTGFFGPSDPFNWVLLSLGSLTFWAPNLSLVLLLWTAKALAFLTAWKALSLITVRAWQRNVGAAAYALLPALAVSVDFGEFPAIIATIILPWLVYSVARAAGLGRSGSARSDSRTWSWVGLSGVLLAILGAASPPAAMLGLAALALFSYLVFGLGQPLALLAEPTLGVTTKASPLEALFDIADWATWPLAVIVVCALGSLLVKRWVVSSVLAGFGVLAFATLMFTQSLEFTADLVSAKSGLSSVVSSGHSVAAVVGLVLIALTVHFLSSIRQKTVLVLLATVISVSLLPSSFIAATGTSQLSAVDDGVVPLLLQKQADQGTDLRLLVINQSEGELRAEITELSGTHLEDSNLAYRFAGLRTSESLENQQLAQVIADLAAGNGAANGESLISNQIGYILVPNKTENANLVSSLESSTLLEGAGLTPFGDLWRVVGTSAENVPSSEQSPWSITKVAQLMALLGFVLLAIPARPRVRRVKDSQIFIDQSESELDV
jgi:hypothetical protein